MRKKRLVSSNWRDFEKFIAALWDKMGYSTEVSQKTRDGGYDVKCQGNRKKVLIECKRQKNPVGVSAVRGVDSARNVFDTSVHGYVITTAKSYTNDAQEHARKRTRLKLFNRQDLMELIRSEKTQGLVLKYLAQDDLWGGVYQLILDGNTSFDSLARSCYPRGINNEELDEILHAMEDDGLVEYTGNDIRIKTLYL